jgi:hypothetical protein
LTKCQLYTIYAAILVARKTWLAVALCPCGCHHALAASACVVHEDWDTAGFR